MPEPGISDQPSERKGSREHVLEVSDFWTRTHHDWNVLVLFSETGGLRITDESSGREESGSFYIAAKSSAAVDRVERSCST